MLKCKSVVTVLPLYKWGKSQNSECRIRTSINQL